MRKKILSLMLAMVMLYAFVPCVQAAETRRYSEDNDSFLPIEVTNVVSDSIEDVPTDVDDFLEYVGDSKDYYEKSIERLGYTTAVPTFLRIRCSKYSGAIIIRAQAPCTLTFLKDSIQALYPLSNTGNMFYDYSSCDYDYDSGTRIPLDVEFYKKYTLSYGVLTYEDDLYTFEEALKISQDEYLENNPDGDYIYTKPNNYKFAGVANNSITLNAGEYYIQSLTPAALGAEGWAYYYRYLLKVETPTCFDVSENKVINTSTAEQTAMIVIADYTTDGVLSNVSSQKLTFAAGESKTFDVPENGNLFVWDSFDGMRPLTK